MSLAIEIPVRLPDNFGVPLNSWIKILEETMGSNESEIIFDFSKVKFLNPLFIGGLTGLYHRLMTDGKSIEIIPPNDPYIHEYFKLIWFPDGLETYDEGALSKYHSKTYLPLVVFPAGALREEESKREEILTAINSLLKIQLGLDGQIFDGIRYMLDELTQNIADHSESPRGMVFAQFFETKNYMDICIVDYGKGLFQSYIDNGKHETNSHEEAINHAVYGKSTKDIPESRGFGLSTSRKMLTAGLKGKFFLYSGEAFFIQTVNREEIVSLGENYYYQGCYIAMRIPIIDNAQFNFYNYIE